MTPAELKKVRHTLGLSLSQMAHVLGYTGKHGAQQVRKMEAGDREIRDAQRRLVLAYLDGHRPDDWPKVSTTPKPVAETPGKRNENNGGK